MIQISPEQVPFPLDLALHLPAVRNFRTCTAPQEVQVQTFAPQPTLRVGRVAGG
jgi:hypothetical protein